MAGCFLDILKELLIKLPAQRRAVSPLVLFPQESVQECSPSRTLCFCGVLCCSVLVRINRDKALKSEHSVVEFMIWLLSPTQRNC